MLKKTCPPGLIVMKRITYLTCTLLVACMVAAMVGWSMAAANFLIPVIAIPLGVIVVLACRAQVDPVIADEREKRIRVKQRFARSKSSS